MGQAGSQPKGVQGIESKPKPIAAEKVVVPVRGTGNLQSRLHGGTSSIKISIAQCGEQFELSCSDLSQMIVPRDKSDGRRAL